MKKLTLSLCALVALGSAAFAGTETYSKKGRQWCRRHARSGTRITNSTSAFRASMLFTRNRGARILISPWITLGGGAIDAKYFMHRYFGFGVQGFIVGANTHEIGDNGFSSVSAD